MNDGAKLHWRYNFFYILGIIGAINVLLITVQWGGIRDLFQYLSFGLTLTSLFLALVAIIFAIFSNWSFTRTVSSLQDASTNISNATRSLSDATKSIDDKIGKLPPMLEGIRGSVDEMPQRIKELTEVQSSVSRSDSSWPVGEKELDYFMRRSSYLGLLALHACERSKKFGKRITISELPHSGGDYFHGFVVACTACGIVDTHEEGTDVVVDLVDERITGKLAKAISDRMDILSADTSFGLSRSQLVEQQAEIDAYFEKK